MYFYLGKKKVGWPGKSNGKEMGLKSGRKENIEKKNGKRKCVRNIVLLLIYWNQKGWICYGSIYQSMKSHIVFSGIQIKPMNCFLKDENMLSTWRYRKHWSSTTIFLSYFHSKTWITEWIAQLFNDLWFQMWNFSVRWDMSFDVSIGMENRNLIFGKCELVILYNYSILNQSAIQCNFKSWMMNFCIYIQSTMSTLGTIIIS